MTHGQLVLRLFGAFEARLPTGGHAELSSRKCEALLAYLALHPGEPQFRDRLATLLWSGGSTQQARHSLRQALATLRRAFEPDVTLLRSSRDTVTLAHDAVEVDVVTFARLLDADDVTMLERAADLYCGPLLDGVTLGEDPFDDWLAQERSRLHRQAVVLLLRLSERSADEDAARRALGRALELDATCEEAHRRLMRFHIAAGRYNAAIVQYNLCAEALRRELDTSPEPQTMSVYESALARSTQDAAAASKRTASGASGERKLVTALCAVLFPVSPGGAADPEVAFEALGPVLEELRTCAERAGGTTISDERDALTVVFGAPIALEDHAASACRAALEMTALAGARERFAFRLSIAVDVGEVVVVHANKRGLVREDVFGNCVRRAQRLATSGRVRAIAVTQPVADLASRFWRFAPVDAISLDDGEPPIDVHAPTMRSIRAKVRATLPGHAAPFLGRQPEIRALKAALDASARGTGQLVAVVGEPGIGKSRLVAEFLRDVSDGWTVAACGGDPQRADAAYVAIAALVRSFLDIPGGGDAPLYDAAASTILGIDPALEPAIPALLSLLEYDVPVATWAELEPAQKRHQIGEAVALLCRRMAARQPAIIVVEDLHWLDPASRRVLERLVEMLPTAHLLLLVNYRPNFAHAWAGLSFYKQMHLVPLSRATSAELVTRLLGEDAGVHPSGQRLVSDTGGNPFFIEECVRAVADLATTGHGFAVPTTVQGVIAARIDQLGPIDKRVLQICAAIGNELSYAVLASVDEFSEEALRGALRRLQAAEFLYETNASASGSYRFKHALTNEVAYGTLLAQTRRELHGRIVAAIERVYPTHLDEHIDALAYHSAESGLLERAADYCARAGLKAVARGANRAAVAYIGQALSALSELPPDPERDAREIDLRFEMRNALFVLGDRDEIWSHLQRAEALAERIDDPVRRGYAALQIAAWHWQEGQPNEARTAGERALALAQEHDDPFLTALAWYRIGLGHHAGGDYPAAVAAFVRSTSLLDERGDRAAVALGGFPYAFCCSFLFWSFAELGDFESALTYGRRGWRLASERNHSYSQTVMTFGLGQCYLAQGRFDEAVRILEKGLALCRIAEAGATFAWVGSLLGRALVATGRPERGVALLREALGDHALRLHRAQLELRLAEACLFADDVREASAAAHRARALAHEHGERANAVWAERVLAEIASHTDAGAAIAGYTRAVALARELALGPQLAAALFGEARLLQAQGRHREADDLRLEATELTDRLDIRVTRS